MIRSERSGLRGQAGHELVLALILSLEIAIFSFLSTNFFSSTNALEIVRLSVELGLLALALTLVIVTGGIDLSVGALLGLCAVLLGKMWRDAGWPIWVAGSSAVVAAAAGGFLNALLVTRLRIPALIVTLGSMSLFRGLAEGLTRGVDNFTGFPNAFLFFGQGYLLAIIPTQVPVFLTLVLGFWLLLHRTTIGRALSAIGFSAEGARHAGIPVERRISLAYILSGASAGLAAVIYVAHAGQAKADAGTGYELAAITAVVLGGTSIFGGRASIPGTLLGLLVIAVLQNGLRLADLPAELSGALTGVLLLTALGLQTVVSGHQASIDWSPRALVSEEGLKVKNSQLAVLCVVIILGAMIVAGSNFLLIKSLHSATGTRGPGADTPGSPLLGPRPLTVAMMPKSKGNAYFIACRKGAEAAARELGVQLIWDGPTDPDPAKQNEIVDTWITRGVDVIAVAVENRDGISSVLLKARERGIKVLTWDADSVPGARDFFVNQATPEGIGQTLMDNAARILGGKGAFAIITASLTAGNMIEWQKVIEARRAQKYPDIKLAALRPCDDLQKKAFDEANTILNAYPNVKVIMAICSPAVPGAAEAVKQSGRKDVKVLGLGLPNDNKPYVHEGVTDCVILWNTIDLGYLTIHAASALVKGTLKAGLEHIDAGRLGKIDIEEDNILLGKPFVFTKENIDRFDF